MKIIYEQDGQLVVVHPSPSLPIDYVIEKDIPAGVSFDVIQDNDIPTDRVFRNAWKQVGKQVQVDLIAAREIAHTVRRTARDIEMLPLDREVTIPSAAAQAEAARQSLRNKYAEIQTSIDTAASVDALKVIVEGLK